MPQQGAASPPQPPAAQDGAFAPQAVRDRTLMQKRTLHALERLHDSHTRAVAASELDALVAELNPRTLPAFLSCVYPLTQEDSAAARRECALLFGRLAATHKDALVPHLGRITANLMHRLNDVDSQSREAVANSLSLLARHCVPEGLQLRGFAHPLLLLLTPVCNLLQSPNKFARDGAGLCLARLVYACSQESLARLLPELLNVFVRVTGGDAAPHSVFSALSNLVMIVEAPRIEPALPQLLASLRAALLGSNWRARLAALQCLEACANRLADSRALRGARRETLRALESARYDKVAQVRAAAAETLAAWRVVCDGEEHADEQAAPAAAVAAAAAAAAAAPSSPRPQPELPPREFPDFSAEPPASPRPLPTSALSRAAPALRARRRRSEPPQMQVQEPRVLVRSPSEPLPAPREDKEEDDGRSQLSSEAAKQLKDAQEDTAALLRRLAAGQRSMLKRLGLMQQQFTASLQRVSERVGVLEEQVRALQTQQQPLAAPAFEQESQLSPSASTVQVDEADAHLWSAAPTPQPQRRPPRTLPPLARVNVALK